MDENIKIQGIVNYLVKDSNGNIKEDRTINNLVTVVGKTELAGLFLTDIGGTAFDYVALGTGSGKTAVSTILAAEIVTNGGERKTGTGTRVTTTTNLDTSQIVVTYNFTGALAITEAGTFNAAVANTGTMFSYQDFAAINVGNGDSLQITWKIKFS